jgi:hypothetical protein
MRGEHGVVIFVSKVKVTILQGWDLSQMDSNYAYSLQDVRGDQCVLVVPWDFFLVNCTIQGWDIIR